MTTLSFPDIVLRSGNLNGESALPSILPVLNVQTEKSALLDDEDEIFTDVGKIPSIYPYTQQNLYDRALEPRTFHAAVLENDYLKATFLPELGGRLWSLLDKTTGRDLLYVNDAVRYCNLALRNAWFSGGVEWNIGMIGHTPFTCAPLFTAQLEAADGTPVLRMYEYERLRGATYQMDFSLPENSRLLLCRMRIRNCNNRTIPMYWWSNIAVPETPDRRIIVPADSSYYSYWNRIAKTPIPMRGNRDATYPVNTECSMDYFFRLDEEKRRYIAALDKNGYGLVQTSTRRLRGRKLFVWGQSEGGHTWQRFLTDKAGDYAEIQAGLARTQYECIPMPPLSAWEWVEGYGAMTADPSEVHGDWMTARGEVEKQLESIVAEKSLEEYLTISRADYALKPATPIRNGSGFGALENRRREKDGEPPLSPHLDFGMPDDVQRDWTTLLETGKLPCPSPDYTPPSYMTGGAWRGWVQKAREQDEKNWYAHYQEGMMWLGSGDRIRAETCLQTAASLQPSCWSSYGLAACRYADGDLSGAIEHILHALSLRPGDVSLARDVFRFLQEAKRDEAIIACFEQLPPALQQDGKLRFYLAGAYVHIGELEKAEAIFYGNGGLIVPNIREGEMSLTELWFELEEKKQRLANGFVEPNSLQPPAGLDFRMGYAQEG